MQLHLVSCTIWQFEKSGINRYGFTLPMDDSLASVSIDFGGRSWLEWEVTFKRR